MVMSRLRELGFAAVVAAMATGTVAWGQSVRVGSPEAPARHEGTIRLATYNIENLFDDRDDPSLTGRHDDFYSRDKTDRAKPESQRRAVAEAIRASDADVIGLQEIESYDALIEFREGYLSGLGYEHVVSIDVGQERGIEQAVLSRFPIKEATVWPHWALGGVHPEMYGNSRNWYAGEPVMYRRSPLYVRVEVPAGARANEEAYEVELFVVHHKSGRYNDYWREKEAAALVKKIEAMEAADSSRNIAVLGDFNATPDEKSVEMYRAAGMRHVFDRSDTRPVQTHSSGRAIDFILVNGALAKEVVEGSAFVYGTPVLDEGRDWRTTPPPAGYASDHMLVGVDIVAGDR